jgi:hypothetical protein
MLCLTAIGTAAGMLILPGAGAYALHQPAPDAFGNFGADAGTWHGTSCSCNSDPRSRL